MDSKENKWKNTLESMQKGNKLGVKSAKLFLFKRKYKIFL